MARLAALVCVCARVCANAPVSLTVQLRTLSSLCAGGATAMQVEAVVVGGHCAELYPSLILRVGPESQLLFHAGAGLQRYWCALDSGSTTQCLLSAVS